MTNRHTLHTTLCICGTLWLSLWPAYGAPSRVTGYPTLIAAFSMDAPLIDGDLSEAPWQSATTLDSFRDIAGADTPSKTTAKVLRAGDTLFIAITASTASRIELDGYRAPRDSDIYTGECVEVFVDPGASLRSYFHFIVNPANAVRDEVGDKGGAPPYDDTWNGAWRSATRIADDAWYAEIAIPFSDLGLEPGRPALVGLNVCRNDTTTGALVCWSPTLSGFHEPARFGLASLPVSGTMPQATVGRLLPEEARIGKFEQPVTIAASKQVNLTGSLIAGNERGRLHEPFVVPEPGTDGSAAATASYEIEHAGDNALIVALADAAGNTVALSKSVVAIPEVFAGDYGHRVRGGETLGLWWADGTRKVHRDKPLPAKAEDVVHISAAAREYEAVQLVFQPQRDTDVSVTVSEFVGPGGVIEAGNFKLYEVAYVPVNIPTDKFGWVDDWPDPIPALKGALRCQAGQNQPVWLLAYVPPGTRPGTYRGRAHITADGKTLSVAIRLRVWGFELTEETHMRTAYGVGPRYTFQGVTDPAQQREVYDLFMQSCREHRIAPYSPMAHYPMDIKTIAPTRGYSYGRMALRIDQGDQHPWKLLWDGKQIATQRTSMTHFEREGLGWQGTGMGWPYINAIESVTQLADKPNMKVLELVAAHTGSGEANRSFKLTFRVYVPAGDNWFGWRLVKFESTDKTPYTVREYYNIPRTEYKATAIANGPDFAAWADDKVGFGMLRLGNGAAGPEVKTGQQHITMGNRVAEFKVRQGDTREGWGPLVIYFLTDKTSAEGLASTAAGLRASIDPANPTSYTPAKPREIAVTERSDYGFGHDFTRFDRGARRYLDEFGFNAFNLRCMPGSIAGHARFTDEYKRLHKLMYGPVIEHMRRNGWLRYAYSYWYDEPTEEAYPHVIEGMKLLGDNCPGLTRLLTEQPEVPLFDVIDLWVPVLSNYRAEDCHARQQAGDQVWWYVCCGPRAPYPNNFVDHPAINHRIRFWMAHKYGVQGSLYWSTTFYGTAPETGKMRNPYEDGMTYRPSGGYWGNGDGMLLYPPCRTKSAGPLIEGPVESIRWEMLRDGIEDYEYMWTLEQEIARLEARRPTAAGTVRATIDGALQRAREALRGPDRLIESVVMFNKDPGALLAQREGLARSIEACRRIK